MGKIFNAVLRLRRDTDYNYAKVKDTFIPADGEVCLIDTSDRGLQAVCGDGKTSFGELDYITETTLVRGYYYNNQFYKDATHSILLFASQARVYLDIPTYKLYIYDGKKYENISAQIPSASDQIAGIMKLYHTTGENTDGTMTQKAITTELKEKVEMKVEEADEALYLDYNI